MAVRTLEYPAALHFDYLEGFLTLSYVRRLCEETDTGLLPSLGLYSRNDAVRWAFDHLPLPASQQLMQHLDSIRIRWPEHHPRLPDPHSIPNGAPAEEREAFDFQDISTWGVCAGGSGDVSQHTAVPELDPAL